RQSERTYLRPLRHTLLRGLARERKNAAGGAGAWPIAGCDRGPRGWHLLAVCGIDPASQHHEYGAGAASRSAGASSDLAEPGAPTGPVERSVPARRGWFRDAADAAASRPQCVAVSCTGLRAAVIQS